MKSVVNIGKHVVPLWLIGVILTSGIAARVVGARAIATSSLFSSSHSETLESSSGGVDQFRIVNVTLTVKDYDGTVMKDAEVQAVSEDWGFRSPDWFGLTNASGRYVFEIPIGNWSFFAGGGWRYIWDNPGEGYFAIRRFAQITDDLELTVQPNDTITVDVFDMNSQPLDAEIRMMDTDHVPIVMTPTCGKTNNGEITIQVTHGPNYDILLHTPRDVQPGYVIHKKNVQSGSSLEVRPTLSTITHLTLEAYDTVNNPTNGLTSHINYHGFSVGTTTGFQPITFSVNGTADIYATPELIRIAYAFDKNGWHFSFVGNDYNLTAGAHRIFKFGGPPVVDINILRQNTQIWLDVRDSFGNVMVNFANPAGKAPVLIRLTRDGMIIYESDISENVGSWNALVAGKLDVTYDTADSPDFEIPLDLGCFGFFHLTGTLLAEENLLHYETIETEHFIINAPEGFSDRFRVMASLFESAYNAESKTLRDELTYKTEITFYINHIAAGFAGANSIGMGIGFSLDSSYNVVPSTFIGVAFHELGHVFQLSPPLDNFFITSWFGEPFATLLGHEAIRQTLGWKFDLHQQGGHNRFFEYLKGKETLDLGENVQFVLFYLRRTYGMEIHRNFVQLWANSTLSALKSELQNAGFNTNEILVTLYSYLAGENLAWLFEIAGVGISETRIQQGIELITDDTAPTTTDNYDGLWHNTDFAITLTAVDDLSGVAETYYKINGGQINSVKLDGQPQIMIEGANNKLEYWSTDKDGNVEVHVILAGIKLDRTPPTGSIAINNNVTYTTSTSVTLSLTTADATSGVYQVRYSNDGVWDTEPGEIPSPTKMWTLTSGDGTKTVYYQIEDNAGLLSSTYSDTIILNTTQLGTHRDGKPAFPLWLLAAATAVIGIIIAMTFLWRRRKAPDESANVRD